jgi:hypothetical protein
VYYTIPRSLCVVYKLQSAPSRPLLALFPTLSKNSRPYPPTCASPLSCPTPCDNVKIKKFLRILFILIWAAFSLASVSVTRVLWISSSLLFISIFASGSQIGHQTAITICRGLSHPTGWAAQIRAFFQEWKNPLMI